MLRAITTGVLLALAAANAGADEAQIRRVIEEKHGAVKAMFADPYCPACRQFEQTLQKVNDITIYVFMFPVIRPELADQSKQVWCSPDRAKAWLDVALRGKPPTAKADCADPVAKNLM